MADTLARLAGPTTLLTGDTTVFTGLAGHTYTIRNILLVNNTGSNIAVSLGINGLTDQHLILPETTVEPGGMGVGNDVLTLTGAETIEARVDVDGLTITLSGLDQT